MFLNGIIWQLAADFGKGVSAKARRILEIGEEVTSWGKSQVMVDYCEDKYGGLVGVRELAFLMMCNVC